MKTQQAIESKLAGAFEALVLQVENESHKHSVPPNSETHFKVTLVAPEFEGQMKVRRHQSIYSVLSGEMAGGVHALALHLYSPREWQESGQVVPESPNCMGGSVKDPAMSGGAVRGDNS